VVRDFLTYGPIKVGNKEYGSLTQYYLEIVKKIQKGHNCNVQTMTIFQSIMSPTLRVNGCLLNQGLAVVCDVVHWGLSDYLKKRLPHDNNQVVNVSCFVARDARSCTT
jgi:hypothetical protein